MATDKGEDNFRLTLLSIRELQTAHRRTEEGLQEVRKGLQAALLGIDHVAEAQAQARDRVDDILAALESIAFNSVATQKRLADVEQRLERLEESA